MKVCLAYGVTKMKRKSPAILELHNNIYKYYKQQLINPHENKNQTRNNIMHSHHPQTLKNSSNWLYSALYTPRISSSNHTLMPILVFSISQSCQLTI